MTKEPCLPRLIGMEAVVTAAIAGIAPACASSNLLEAYIGAAYGHATLSARDSGLVLAIPGLRWASVDVGRSAYQISAGVRGLDLLGAEIDYFDFGGNGPSSVLFPPSAPTATLMRAQIAQKGEAAFAML